MRNSNSIVSNTRLNIAIAGFIQPDGIVTLLNGTGYDGFCDRQFFVCPPELDKDYDEIVQPLSDVVDLKDVFRLLDKRLNNTTSNICPLSKEAHNEFVAFHDELNVRKRARHRRDRDQKSVLSKVKGQVVRLAAVMYAIHQAIASVENEDVMRKKHSRGRLKSRQTFSKSCQSDKLLYRTKIFSRKTGICARNSTKRGSKQ